MFRDAPGRKWGVVIQHSEFDIWKFGDGNCKQKSAEATSRPNTFSAGNCVAKRRKTVVFEAGNRLEETSVGTCRGRRRPVEARPPY